MCLNRDGYYVKDFKDKCMLVSKGNIVGRMFTLDVNMPEVNAAMFAHGQKLLQILTFGIKYWACKCPNNEVYANKRNCDRAP